MSPDLSPALAWTVLITSGAFETMWAYALAANHLRFPRRILLFLVGTAVSMGGLSVALGSIPVGTGYAVWVGIGAVTTLLLAVLQRRESMTWVRAIFVAVLLTGVVGLQVVS
jgi:quaternary ammonium compound-resistance protein SugE